MHIRHAIRYNILVNPTGREHRFRAVDWVVELMNLFFKETYGGEGPNYTKKRILDESALVMIYRNCHHIFEQNFLLSGLTYSHAAKDMTSMFKEVLDYILTLATSPNKHLAGRITKYEVPNAIEQGAARIMLETSDSELSNDGNGRDVRETNIDENYEMYDESESSEGSMADDESRVGEGLSARDLAADEL